MSQFEWETDFIFIVTKLLNIPLWFISSWLWRKFEQGLIVRPAEVYLMLILISLAQLPSPLPHFRNLSFRLVRPVGENLVELLLVG